MSYRAALITGTIVSVAVTAAWSYMAALTIGPAAPLHLGRNLLADYAALASAPTGNGPELFAVIALIYMTCLAVARRRVLAHRRAQAGDE